MPRKKPEEPEETETEKPNAEVETEFKKVETVEELEGVGKVTAEKLEAAGLNTLEMLAVCIPENLRALDIEDKQAKKIIIAARKQVNRFGLEFRTADKVLEEHKARWKLSTHVKPLDEVLGGGFESTTVNTIHALFGHGKTQTVHWAMACMLVDNKDANILFVDTENSFRPERLLNFLETLGGTEEDLKRVIAIDAINSACQRIIIEHAGRKIKEVNVKLLIIDSATAHFRSEYIGRDQLSPRQQILNAHLQVVSKLTRMFDLVTLITNQEIFSPVVGYGGGAVSKGVGGAVFGHKGFMNLGLWKPDNPQSPLRIFTVEKHPSLPPHKAEVFLTEQGFSEVKEKK